MDWAVIYLTRRIIVSAAVGLAPSKSSLRGRINHREAKNPQPETFSRR